MGDDATRSEWSNGHLEVHGEGPAVPRSAALILALVQVSQALGVGQDAVAPLLLLLLRLLRVSVRGLLLLLRVGAGPELSTACRGGTHVGR